MYENCNKDYKRNDCEYQQQIEDENGALLPILKVSMAIIAFIFFAVIGCTLIYFNQSDINQLIIPSTKQQRSLSSSKKQSQAIQDLLNTMYAYNMMNTGFEKKKEHLFWALLHDSDKHFENVDKFMPYYFIGNESLKGFTDYFRYENMDYDYLETRKQIADNTWDKEMNIIREDLLYKRAAIDSTPPKRYVDIPQITEELKEMYGRDNNEIHNFDKLINDKFYYQNLFSKLVELQGEFINEIGEIMRKSAPKQDANDEQDSYHWTQHFGVNGERFEKQRKFKEDYANNLDKQLKSSPVYQELFGVIKKITESIHLYRDFNNNLQKHWNPLELNNTKGLSYKNVVFHFKHSQQQILIVNDKKWDHSLARDIKTKYKRDGLKSAIGFLGGDAMDAMALGFGYISNDHHSILKYQEFPGLRLSSESWIGFDDLDTEKGGLYRPFTKEYSQVVRYVNQGISSDYITMFKCIKTLIHLAKLNDIGDYLSYIDKYYNKNEYQGAGNIGDEIAMEKNLTDSEVAMAKNHLKNNPHNLNSALNVMMYTMASPQFVPAAMMFNEFVFQCKAFMFAAGVPLAALIPTCYLFDYGGPLILHFIGNWYQYGSIVKAWKETKRSAGKLYDPNYYKLMKQSEDLLLPNLFIDLETRHVITKYKGMSYKITDKKKMYKWWENPSFQGKIYDIQDDEELFNIGFLSKVGNIRTTINIPKVLGQLLLNDLATYSTTNGISWESLMMDYQNDIKIPCLTQKN